MALTFLQKRSGNSGPKPALTPEELANAAEFKEGTSQERLIAKSAEKEGDDFTIDAIVKLNSIDANAAVRTIASRWNAGKDTVESFGWSLGVTGEKSRFKPRNLIVQLVGEDENANITYEPVASDLRLELGVEYRVSARVSCSAHTVTFRLQEVGKSNAPILASVAQHGVRRKLTRGSSDLVVGGLTKRAPQHQWDGRIEAARIVPGILTDEELAAAPADWKPTLALWAPKAGAESTLAWAGADKTAPADPMQQAMADLCHILLNANEFFYLH